MNPLRLGLELSLQFGFGLEPFVDVGFRPGIDFVERGRQVRQHEGIGVLRA